MRNCAGKKRSRKDYTMPYIKNFFFSNSTEASWSVATYIAGVDKPGNVSKGRQFSVHEAADFAVFPAVVDVNQGHHVPLQQRNKHAVTLETCYALQYSWSYQLQRDISKSAFGEDLCACSISLIPSHFRTPPQATMRPNSVSSFLQALQQWNNNRLSQLPLGTKEIECKIN